MEISFGHFKVPKNRTKMSFEMTKIRQFEVSQYISSVLDCRTLTQLPTFKKFRSQHKVIFLARQLICWLVSEELKH